MTGSWTVGPGQHLVERRHVVAGAGGRRGERDVLVQRRVLVARRRLDGGDDLARDAELGEVAEARLAIGAEVADRLVEADEALLDEIVGVAAGEEVRGGLQAHEAVVAPDEPVVGVAIALLRQGDQEAILDLRFRVRVMGDSSHEQILSSAAFAGRPQFAQWRTPPLAPTLCIPKASSTLGSALCWREPRTVMERCQGRLALLQDLVQDRRRGGADAERLDPPAQRQRDQLRRRPRRRAGAARAPRCRARARRRRRRSRARRRDDRRRSARRARPALARSRRSTSSPPRAPRRGSRRGCARARRAGARRLRPRPCRPPA